MSISLMTSVPGESRFLLEDTSISKKIELPTPRLFKSVSGLRGWLKQKLSFSREMNHRPVACHQYSWASLYLLRPVISRSCLLIVHCLHHLLLHG
jgi:hypothetical protein